MKSIKENEPGKHESQNPGIPSSEIETNATLSVVPANCEAVNGHLVCRNDDELYDIFTRGEGWWAFNMTQESALSTANTISAA